MYTHSNLFPPYELEAAPSFYVSIFFPCFACKSVHVNQNFPVLEIVQILPLQRPMCWGMNGGSIFTEHIFPPKISFI